ncbi:MAG: 30S ribosomal protein S6e [Methanimicrococcus sp.]|nr:30S ribosomal protein S6e [Methanimicrococcus sp.]
MAMKMVLADPKTGKSYKLELDAAKEKEMVGKTIGTEMDTAFVGLPGYSMKITGGTDKSGFVMKNDLPGPAKRKILGATGLGFTPKINGQRRRKFIRGNEISLDTAQINAKIIGYGDKKIEKLLGLEPEEEPAAEEVPTEEAPAETAAAPEEE